MKRREARALLNEAEGYTLLRRYGEAIRRIRRVGRSGHFPFETALRRGEVHRERGRYRTGIGAYRRALSRRPGDVAATIGLGWCQKRSGALDEAIETYRRALPAHPSEPILHFNLACYLSLRGDREEALASLDQAIRIDAGYASLAREEEDFAPLRQDPRFPILTDS